MDTVNGKTAVTLICLGIVIILASLPLYLRRIGINHFYGFRIGKAFESEENWYLVNKFGAKALMCWSVVIMIIGILCLYVEPQHVLAIAKVSFVSIFAPMILTYFYARRL